MNGGKAPLRNSVNDRPRIVIDGADLVINATATDTAVIGIRASSTTTHTITGDVPALMTLWLAKPFNGQRAQSTLRAIRPITEPSTRCRASTVVLAVAR